MVGVGVGPRVGLPSLVCGVRLPDLPVPDHVHDPQATGVGVRVAIAVGSEQPGEEVLGHRRLRRAGGIDRPVVGPALLVLRDAADRALPPDAERGSGRVGGLEQVAQGDGTRLGRGVTGALAVVGGVRIDDRPERPGERRRFGHRPPVRRRPEEQSDDQSDRDEGGASLHHRRVGARRRHLQAQSAGCDGMHPSARLGRGT